MKWLLCSLLLVVPVTVRAETPFYTVIAEGWGFWSHGDNAEMASLLAVVPKNHDLEAVRASVRFYIKPHVSRKQIHKVPCKIIVNSQHVGNISEHLIESSHGAELWFSHIPKNVVAELVMRGKEFPPELYAVTFEVSSDQGMKASTWKADTDRPQKGTMSFDGYEEVTIQDICQLDG